jgi:serine/threonine protein kinase
MLCMRNHNHLTMSKFCPFLSRCGCQEFASCCVPGMIGKAHMKLSRQQALSVYNFMQVVHALEALHAAGWIHRDVKPHNVLLERRGSSTAKCLQPSPTAMQHQTLGGSSQASSMPASPTEGNASSIEYLCVLTDLGSCCEAAGLKVCKPLCLDWELAEQSLKYQRNRIRSINRSTLEPAISEL